MSDLTACLETVVGLSDSPCACYDPKPAGYSTSLSGYYLTEQKSGIPLRFLGTSADCETGGAWDILAKARKEGIRQFIRDLTEASANYRSSRPSFNGRIGNADFNGLSVVSKPINGQKIVPYANTKGGWLLISAVSMNVSATGSYTVEIYSSEDVTAPLASEVVTVGTANTWTAQTLTTPLEVPLWKQDCKLTYFVVYDRLTAQAANNTLHCGCGSIATKKAGAPWLEWVEVSGLNVAAVSDLADQSVYRGGTAAYGLQVHARIGCREHEWMCDLEYDFDRGSEHAHQISKAIQLAGAANVASYIVQSREINRYTGLEREVIYGKRNGMISHYGNIIEWLAANKPDYVNDCTQCNSKTVKMVTARL